MRFRMPYVAAVLVLFVPAGPANADTISVTTLERQSHPRPVDGETNTGVADTAPAPEIVPADPSVLAAYLSFAQAIGVAPPNPLVAPKLRAMAPAQASTTNACIDTCGTYVAARSVTMPNPIFYEGQGNNGAYWTCGPSATRNIVAGMTGRDYGEGTIATWEGTTQSNGTYIGNISGTLNSKFGSSGTLYHGASWGISKPASATDLRADVYADENSSHPHGTILGVKTNYYPFWGGYSADHYDTASGYDYRTSYTVTIAEEYNRSHNGVDPYGFHTVDSTQAYAAVNHSPPQELVW